MVLEPVSAIGFGIGVFSFLVTTVVTAPSAADSRWKKIKSFTHELQALDGRLRKCEGQIADWDAFWDHRNFAGDVEGEELDRVQESLWGKNCYWIKQDREYLEELGRELSEKVENFTRVGAGDRDREAWIRNRMPRRIKWMAIRWSLVSSETFESLIKRLETTIDNLQRLSGLEKKRLLGMTQIHVEDGVLARLGQLRTVGDELFDNLPAIAGTCDWSLELRAPKPGEGAAAWNRSEAFDMMIFGVAFQRMAQNPATSNTGHDRRFEVQYRLGTATSPRGWESSLLLDEHIEDQDRNPVLTPKRGYDFYTWSFRKLFGEEFFDQKTFRTWQHDRICLVQSLVNWAGLLWHTKWMAQFCCSNLCFVKSSSDQGISLHALKFANTCHDYEVLDLDCEGYERCGHRTWHGKWVNFGLCMAEIICRTPFRIIGNGDGDCGFQQWTKSSEGTANWFSIEETKILNKVEQSCPSFRRPVEFCLSTPYYVPPDELDKVGRFYHELNEEVIEP